MCCITADSTDLLKGALKETSSGCTILVQPTGTKIGVILHSFSSTDLISSILWALCMSNTSRDSCLTNGFQQFLAQYPIATSSHQAFFWKCTITRLSYSTRSRKLIRFPVPLKIKNGLTLGTPSAKMVSCTVHCRFSSPDPPPRTQTVEAFVVSYVGPSTKENGSGVWSTLEIWLRLNLSSWGPSPSSGSWTSRICWWNSWMAASLSLGGVCAVLVLF